MSRVFIRQDGFKGIKHDSQIDEHRRTCHDCGAVFKTLGDKRQHRKMKGKNKR